MQLDDLDRKATEAFEGYVVRKDLVRTFSRQFPVPTYVVEFLLGRYCATTDEAEIQEGLDIVQRQLGSRTVKAGEEELFKARARESGSVKIIDIITARLDSKTDSYVATLPSLRLNEVRLTPEMVKEQRAHADRGLLRRGHPGLRRLDCPGKGRPTFWCGRPLRAIQLSKREVLDVLARPRAVHHAEWRDLLLRSVGFEPETSVTAPRMRCCCEWSPLSSATTTWWSSARAARASRTFSSRFRPMRTSFPVARPPWPACS
jgi:ATP-dependent Lon protease